MAGETGTLGGVSERAALARLHAGKSRQGPRNYTRRARTKKTTILFFVVFFEKRAAADKPPAVGRRRGRQGACEKEGHLFLAKRRRVIAGLCRSSRRIRVVKSSRRCLLNFANMAALLFKLSGGWIGFRCARDLT
jgi:hypothetical protein